MDHEGESLEKFRDQEGQRHYPRRSEFELASHNQFEGKPAEVEKQFLFLSVVHPNSPYLGGACAAGKVPDAARELRSSQ